MEHHDWEADFAADADTEEIVMIGDLVLDAGREPLYYIWRAAHAEAERAWQHWRAIRDVRSYYAYQAALDREDAAQHAFALDATSASPRCLAA